MFVPGYAVHILGNWLMVIVMQVFEHEATVRLMAGASPARNFERHNSSTLRRRHRKLSAAITADRLKNTVPISTCFSVLYCFFVFQFFEFSTLFQVVLGLCRFGFVDAHVSYNVQVVTYLHSNCI